MSLREFRLSRIARPLLLPACGLVLSIPAALGLHAVTINEFVLPGPSPGTPLSITAGPDGNLWFTESFTNKIGRITTSGAITEFTVPTADSFPWGIASGPDGNLWFTENHASKIGRITPSGVITEYPTPTPDSGPTGITSGPDGNLWFVEEVPWAGRVGRITTAGAITEFQLPYVGIRPTHITSGPDGNLWFTEANGGIGRITTAGVLTEFDIPTVGGMPSGITAGPDGNLWFTEYSQDQIGRITTSGEVTEFTIPTYNCAPWWITSGPDGTLWFTEWYESKIGHITPTGTITEYALPNYDSEPAGIAVGPDGNLWFTEYAGRIAQVLTPATATVSGDATICPSGSASLWVTLTGSAPWNLEWSDGFVQNGVVANPATRSASPPITRTYWVTLVSDLNGTGTPFGSATIAVEDSTAPVVTPPGDLTLDQTICCGTFGGTTPSSGATLAAFLAGATATDNCVASSLALPPQIAGLDVTSATCFESGTTVVTFRFQDGATPPNVGTASANVIVRMYGDLNLDGSIDATDVVLLRGYLNLAISPGTPPFNAPEDIANVNHDLLGVDATDWTVLRGYLSLAISCLAP